MNVLPGVPRRFPRLTAVLTVVALCLGLSILAMPDAALADTAPPNTTVPATVSADALPTVQVDGVVWQQAILGNVVYAVGHFSTARPAGAPAGTSTVPRKNILAYNLSTGALITTFAPVLNAEAYTVKASPDGRRLYVGGLFTSVNGASVWRVAALDPVTGALVTSWLPKPSASVRAIAVQGNNVYLGGSFTTVGSIGRSRLAAFAANTGALLPWAPKAGDGQVNALQISPDGAKMVVGGSFTTLNGSGNPGYGLGAVSVTSGALVPFAANAKVRNAGPNSSIMTLSADANAVYGAGYVFGSGGNLEGTFSANWTDGSVQWIEDCHGDTYSLYAGASALYAAGHPHYCGNIGGFPETTPRSWHRAVAFGKQAVGVITKEPYGYTNWAGTPSPSLLDWFPDMDTGTFTGQSQGPWTVTGNAQYVVYGGEFRNVNGVGQQGLVRFALRTSTVNKQGPRVSGASFNPRLQSLTPGTVRISWPANWDRDNERLTYQIIRDSNTAAPIYTTSALSRFYSRPLLSYWDSGLVPGSAHTYRLTATDPLGNVARSDTVSITVSSNSASSISGYGVRVLKDGAVDYWRLGESSGSTVNDLAGTAPMTAGTGVTRQAAGAITGDADRASSFDGTGNGFAATQTSIPGPNTYTAEAWFKTTSTSGGKVLGFGGAATGDSAHYDRQIYLDNTGRVFFGNNNGTARTVNSTARFNDGRWHHVAASLSPGGMQLYVDGTLVGQRSDTTTAQTYWGFWRLGGDKTAGWPSAPTSGYLKGTIDEAAVYQTALTASVISGHYKLGISGGN
jgi:hypothetical protein